MIYKPREVSDFCTQPCIDGRVVVVDLTTGHEVTTPIAPEYAEAAAADFNRQAGWPGTIFQGDN